MDVSGHSHPKYFFWELLASSLPSKCFFPELAASRRKCMDANAHVGVPKFLTKSRQLCGHEGRGRRARLCDKGRALTL